ncbi:hypothetical protein AAMO2058_000312500 [Amorphochlora amoebiformis]
MASNPRKSLDLTVEWVSKHRYRIAKGLLWIGILYYIGTKDQNLGMTFILFSGFYVVLSHLCTEDSDGDVKKEGYSAYAALNEDGYRLPGTFTAEQYEGELRNRPRRKEKIEVRSNAKEKIRRHYDRKSKAANLPCVCGSRKKYKKCCGLGGGRKKEAKDDFKKWEDEWT